MNTIMNTTLNWMRISLCFVSIGFFGCSDNNPLKGSQSSGGSSSSEMGSSSGLSSIAQSSNALISSSGLSSTQLASSGVSLSSGASSAVLHSSSAIVANSSSSSKVGSSSSQALSSSAFVGPPANSWCKTAGHCSYIVDPRDGNSYQTTKIAGMTWLAENLRYVTPAGYTAGHNSGIYNFQAAQIACPSGWHLPSMIEWNLLLDTVGNSSGELKIDSMWWASAGNVRADAFGFHAMPEFTKMSNTTGIFGTEVSYWQYPQHDNTNGDYVHMRYDDDYLYIQYGDTATGYAQRCVQDPETKIPTSSWCNTAGNCGTFTDARDGQTYGWTKINGRTWMSQNLNYSGDNGAGGRAYNKGWCYGVSPNDTTDHSESRMCSIAGRLYNYADAQTVCPAGWHLSDTTDFVSLKNQTSGGKLAGLIPSNSGYTLSDSYGFSAVPGGERSASGYYGDGGENAYFWVASKVSNGDAEGWHFAYGTYYDFSYDVRSGYSVRCVKTP